MFKTSPIALRKLLDEVQSHHIQLPDFQRGWVWGDDRVRGLLASISRGFPIGAVMMLQSGGDIQFKCRPVEGAEDDQFVAPDAFLLDGQQRITSLYQALRHDGPVFTHDNRGGRIERWYYIDMLKALRSEVDREDAVVSIPKEKIRRNFKREITLDLSSTEKEYEQHMMPTERLMDAMDWLFAYNDYWQDKSPIEHPWGDVAAFRNEFKNTILDNFTGYTLPVISLDKETPKEAVCTVFEKVNTGGVSLNTFELVTAVFAANDFSLRDNWKERREQLYSQFAVLRGITGEQFLQVVALLTSQQRRRQAIERGETLERAPAIGCKKRDLLDLSLEDYNSWADMVQNGFLEAGKFLHRQFVFAEYDVPYNTQLVPLAALYAELGEELKPAKAVNCLERWYWSGIFSEAYGGGSETQFALDLVQVADYVRNGIEPRLMTEASFIPERLISLRTRNSAAYKGLYALQMKSGAADWRTGNPLSLATWHTDNIDIHHIFPVAWCGIQKPEIPRWLYNSVINKTPINAETNRIIGGQSPSRYCAKLDQATDNLDRVLEAHKIRPELLRSDRFAELFVERGQSMFELINTAMGKQSRNSCESFKNALSSAGYTDAFEEEVADYDTVGDAGYFEGNEETGVQ